MDRSRSEWRNEVRMLARVCPHPNICSIKAVYLDNMYARLVLEYCAAGTLLSRVLHVSLRLVVAGLVMCSLVKVNSLEPCHVSPVLRAARRSSSFGNTLLPPPASIDGPMLPPSETGLDPLVSRVLHRRFSQRFPSSISCCKSE